MTMEAPQARFPHPLLSAYHPGLQAIPVFIPVPVPIMQQAHLSAAYGCPMPAPQLHPATINMQQGQRKRAPPRRKAAKQAKSRFEPAMEQPFDEAVQQFHRMKEDDGIEEFDLYNLYHVCKTAGDTSAEPPFTWLCAKASKGCMYSQYYLGRCFETGQGVDQSLGQARRWLERSADQGLMTAVYKMGCFLEHGHGGERDELAAYTAYLRAAKAGIIEAQLRVASWLETGKGVVRNIEEAMLWFRKAAPWSTEAALWMSRYYREGVFCKRDEDTADFWLEQANKLAKKGPLHSQRSDMSMASITDISSQLSDSFTLDDTAQSHRELLCECSSSDMGAGSSEDDSGAYLVSNSSSPRMYAASNASGCSTTASEFTMRTHSEAASQFEVAVSCAVFHGIVLPETPSAQAVCVAHHLPSASELDLAMYAA